MEISDIDYVPISVQGSLKIHRHQAEKCCITERKLFPSTRYYGSKLRLIEWISSNLSNLEYKTALDVFGGTGTVSLMFKSLGKDTTYNDILLSNNYVARSLLDDDVNFDRNKIFNYFKSVDPCDGLISRVFHDHYYYPEENQWLDGAIQGIHRMRNAQKKYDSFYCLVQACLKKRPFNLFHRKNLYIRKNCNRNTKFGNWRTWEKPFSQHIDIALSELSKAKLINAGTASVLLPTDASEVRAGYDLVYIDPPYLKQEGKNKDLDYLDRYHFLEGLADYSCWEKKLNFNKKNIPMSSVESISDWSNKATFKNRLFDLVAKHKKSIVVLSYCSNGYPSQEEIVSYFKKNFKNVSLLEKRLSHALRKTENKEIIVIGC